MNKRFLLLTGALTLVATSPLFALAAEGLSFAGFTGALNSFKGVLNILATVIVALALVYFFWGLAKFILAAGDEEKREESKGIMLWGIIAFVVMIGIWGIVNFLVDAFGFGSFDSSPEIPGVR